jgi:hypothetical protein
MTDAEKKLADAEKKLADAAAQIKVLTTTLGQLAVSNEKLLDSNDRLNTTIITLKEAVRKSETGVTCENFSLSVMFEELDAHYIKYINNNLPPDMLEILSDRGLKLTTWTLVGANRLTEYFDVRYPDMLNKHFEHDTKDLKDDDPAKLALAARHKVILGQVRDIHDKYAEEAADALKKVKDAKRAALQKGDKEGMARAKDTEIIILKGLLNYVVIKFEQFGAANEKLRSKGKTVPLDLIDQYELYITFAKHFRGANAAYQGGYGHAGTFLVYIYSDGIAISDVDVDVVVSYRNAAVKIRSIRKKTALNHTATIVSFLSYLVDDQVNKYKCRYLPALGSLPRYKPPASEKELEREAFKLIVALSKKGVVNVSGGVVTLYNKLHTIKATNIPVLKRNLPLTEICIRISRETGFRYIFLQTIRWGNFRIDEKDAIATDGTKVYQLNLVSTKEEIEKGILSIKRIIAGHKELPDNDFIRISRKLRDQIKAYRDANPDIRDSDYVFSYYDLSNLSRTPANVAKRLPIETWRLILSKLDTIAGGVASVVPMTFRNSYYTLMLAAGGGDLKASFKDWTGDDLETAKTFYKAVSATITLTPSFESSLTYNEVVTRIFDKE